MSAERGLLYRFIADNPELERLEASIRRFNPFAVLGVEHAEIRHSNVLAWLLNPKEPHNLGDLVLRKLVGQVVVNNEDRIPEGLQLDAIYFGDFGDAQVSRERGNIDLLVVSDQSKFALLIENKIHAKESAHQLRKYLAAVESSYPGYTILPVYLTLEGDEPKGDQRYCGLSHRRVLETVEIVLQLHQDRMSLQVSDFVRHYLDTLRRIIEMDKEAVAMCRKIYATHKQALDMIYQVAYQSSTGLRAAAAQFLQQHPELFQTSLNEKQLWCMFSRFKDDLKGLSTGWNDWHPVAVWFSNYYERLKIVLEIGPFTDANRRIAFLTHLENHGFKVRPASKDPSSMYTRIFTDTVDVNDWENTEELADKMSRLYSHHAKREVENLVKAIESFAWKG